MYVWVRLGVACVLHACVCACECRMGGCCVHVVWVRMLSTHVDVAADCDVGGIRCIPYPWGYDGAAPLVPPTAAATAAATGCVNCICCCMCCMCCMYCMYCICCICCKFGDWPAMACVYELDSASYPIEFKRRIQLCFVLSA